MKTLYKNLTSGALSVLVCASLAFPANAQHNNNGSSSSGSSSRPASSSSSSSGGGGGGGSRPSSSGSSSVSSSRPASSGSVGVSRSSGSFSAPQRSSGGYSAPQRSSGGQAYYAPRQGVNGGGVAYRGNTGYAPRQGVTGNAGVYTGGNLNYAPRTRVGVATGGTGYAPRYTYAPRGATSGGIGYRTAPRIGYGNGGGYWGNHGYYHYHRGYYGSYYRPRLGFTCAVLGAGYYPFYFGDFQYYYSDGLYYQYDNNQYTVVEPPIGAEITTLPDKAQSIVINGQQYYELNGVYYQPITKDDGTVVYMIAGKDGELNTTGVQDDGPQGPQMGDIVSELPQDCRKIKVNGEKLWVSPDGVYYQEQIDASGVKTFKVVGLPQDEPQQN